VPKNGASCVLLFVREIKNAAKESMLGMEIKWRRGGKKRNITS